MHSNTRQAANNHALEHSTGSERVDAFGLREMVLGKSRQAHQRTAGSPANAKLTFRYPSSLINHSTLLLERSSAKLLVFYASTRSRRAVEVIICMITRDFSVISIDVTGVSLSLSLLLTKVTHAQYRKRFRVSYNRTLPKRFIVWSVGVGGEDIAPWSILQSFTLRMLEGEVVKEMTYGELCWCSSNAISSRVPHGPGAAASRTVRQTEDGLQQANVPRTLPGDEGERPF